MTTFLLNSGHGEETKGKRSPFVPPGVVEYAFNRAVVMSILEIARSDNIDVVHLDPEYEAVPLKELVRRANEYYTRDNDCLFISVHANAASGGDDQWIDHAHGATALISPHASKASRWFGQLVVDATSDNAVMTNRGVRERNLYLLNKTSGPAIITENGFMTHSAEATKLASEYWRKKIAVAHCKAMQIWIDVTTSTKNV